MLTTLVGHFEVSGLVQTDLRCVDNTIQWSQAKNIWHNAIIRTFFYNLTSPLRWLKRRGRR